ncbi:E3 ubiquitin-protein ligase RNF168 [Camelus dromedarius]|uniref:RING-type E3 ubiquitin transferase n=1 Tax=Camelus dromedarius TaxID=9838 RepID=A0A5N4C1I4_CAMDR|nr:E3 ubiquitin-protein ligase RNF168 [Camelus dromedarius]
MELWETIQKHYPEECKRRASGQESKETVDEHQPVRLLSKPGELKREYEAELCKMEAERRAREEEENKASEEYIQKLLAEEEEEGKRQAEERRREMEEQLKSDEELARKLSIEINSSWEESMSASPFNLRKSDRLAAKSKKKNKNKQTNTGDTQKYLSPESQLASTSEFEVVQEDRKKHISKETDHSDVKTPTKQDIEVDKDMPTCYPQTYLEIQEQGAKSSMESPMPPLCTSDKKRCLKVTVKTRPDKKDEGLCVILHEEPKARVPYFGEAADEPCGQTESGCTGSDTVETENEVLPTDQ